MADFLTEFWKALYFLISPYAANAFPPLVKGKRAIDFGKKFIDGKRLLGDGKTWEGLIAGTLFGTLCGSIAWLFHPKLNKIALDYGFSIPLITPEKAFLLSLAALLGDMSGSFIKRRLGMERGAPAPVLDQLDFFFGSLLIGFFIVKITIGIIIWGAVLTLIIHRIANIIGHLLKIKKEPW